MINWKNADSYDNQYLKIIRDLVSKAENSEGYRLDRTKVGAFSDFGRHMEWDLSKGFPLLVSKFTAFKTMYTEMLFFIKGVTNNNWLTERNCNIWTPWANEDGELGPIYGSQLRNFNGAGFDQLEYVISLLKNNPSSRRIMFTYYNPLVLPEEGKAHKENIENGKAVLPPCHVLYMFDVEERNGVKYLNGSLSQRSADVILGVSFNFAQLALWVHILAHHTGMQPGKIFHFMNNAHIYANQVDDIKLWLEEVDKRKDENFFYPKLEIIEDPSKPIEEYDLDSLRIVDYQHLGRFKFDIAV